MVVGVRRFKMKLFILYEAFTKWYENKNYSKMLYQNNRNDEKLIKILAKVSKLFKKILGKLSL